MTSTHRGISRALVVLALSGAGTGIVGAVSASAHADGLPNPAPLPTTDPTTLLPGGVTAPVPLPGASDSPSPQATDGSSPDSGAASTNGDTSTGSSSAGASTGQTASAQTSTGQASTGAVAAAGKTTGSHPGSSTPLTKGAPAASTPSVSAPTSRNLVKTAGGLTQGATSQKLATTPHLAALAPMSSLMHGLSLPNLPPLPGLSGSALSVGSIARAPIVAAPPVTTAGVGTTSAGNVSAESYRATSNATPTGNRSPVAPALFALVTAAVAAGVAKIRIRWGQR